MEGETAWMGAAHVSVDILDRIVCRVRSVNLKFE